VVDLGGGLGRSAICFALLDRPGFFAAILIIDVETASLSILIMINVDRMEGCGRLGRKVR
jgi:hypothetical protein